jgi:hypothetical protein
MRCGGRIARARVTRGRRARRRGAIAAVGVYTQVRDRWGIFYAQPIVLNERQAGAAIAPPG